MLSLCFIFAAPPRFTDADGIFASPEVAEVCRTRKSVYRPVARRDAPGAIEMIADKRAQALRHAHHSTNAAHRLPP